MHAEPGGRFADAQQLDRPPLFPLLAVHKQMPPLAPRCADGGMIAVKIDDEGSIVDTGLELHAVADHRERLR